MRFLLTGLLFFCCMHSSMAQRHTVKGTVKDTLNVAALPNASVVLINTKDSVIAAFTRSDSAGNFAISADSGKYILRITFPSFADYEDPLVLKRELTDMGTIAMVTKERLLKEFVLTKQVSAIKIKGDTTEYMADSFGLKENANVQDLLKKLPGISVDKDGKITAQGEEVQKVLVDGEEFFSDDPKMITQNLQANVVERVQVYDKKSDQAEFTGVDDGQKTKTINLQLKEDKKKGFFGKIDAGGGTDGYFQEQAMINAFKGKRQISAFAITSNTDKVGLGWQDNNKYGSSELITDEDGNTYSIRGADDDNIGDWGGSYNGQGYPKVWTGGIHYADKWKEDKNHVVANYRFGRQQIEAGGNTYTQYMLPGDTANLSYMSQNKFNKSDRHGADVMYEAKLDSNNSLKVSISATKKNGESLQSFRTITSLRTSELPDDTLYINNRTTTATTEQNTLNTQVLFKKRFKKKGRTLSLDVKENYKDSKSDGSLKSEILPGSASTLPPNVDQAKIVSTQSLSLYGKAIYTEPLTKVLNLEVNYSATLNNSTNGNISKNRDTLTQRYDDTDALYSSRYQYDIFSNVAGTTLRWNYKKLNFSIGGDVSNAQFLQNDLLHDTAGKITYNYTNFFPRAMFKYKVSNQRSFNFTYNGSTQQPTIAQIQPLRQNTDPTNIVVGNPNLKQAFNHRLSIYGNDYKILTDRWLYANASLRFTNNAISSMQFNKDGINTTQYVNVNGNYGVSGWIGSGLKIKKIDLRIGMHASPSFDHSVTYVNGNRNINNNNSYELGFNFNKNKEDKYDFGFNPSITYTDNRATISAYSTSYWISNSEFSGSVELPKKFEIGTDVNFMFRQRTAAFPANNNVIKWNAYVSKKFLKKHNLEVRATVFDILNQNLGNDRTAEGNIITQNNYNTIRRYGMLNVIWNFTHQPGGGAGGDMEADNDN